MTGAIILNGHQSPAGDGVGVITLTTKCRAGVLQIQFVSASATVDLVRTGTALDQVVTVQTIDLVIVTGTVQRVRAICPVDNCDYFFLALLRTSTGSPGAHTSSPRPLKHLRMC
ncbi:hypothetical protein NN484_19240 [Pseudomonas serboccidentalis]|uniref:Uncharacterized protein n=1 Tax=Pseudomonas serboccidentalis TaxID=2964670 RepID=A0ABY7Z5E1_9PSED|nr:MULTISPECIES: hypothetical protein [Pseudomonas]WDR34632.1 hypothetical protein NN484_19240 [Pseudomonas serboccidentalis]